MKMIHTCSDLVTFVGSLLIITHSLESINRTNDTAEKKNNSSTFLIVINDNVSSLNRACMHENLRVSNKIINLICTASQLRKVIIQ